MSARPRLRTAVVALALLAAGAPGLVAPSSAAGSVPASVPTTVGQRVAPAAPVVVSGPTLSCECGGKYLFDNPDYADFVKNVVAWEFSGVPQSTANTYHVRSTPALPADAANVGFYDSGFVQVFTNQLVPGTTYTFTIEERSGSTVVASSSPFSYTPTRVGAPSRIEVHDASGHAMDVFGDAQESFVAGESYTVHFTGSWAAGTTYWNALNYFGPDGITLGQGGKAPAPWTGFTIPADYAGKEVLLEIVGGAADQLSVFFSTARVPVTGDGASDLDLTPASLVGTPKVGATLTARGGTSPAAPARTFQWLRDGAVITGATSATYQLRTTDAGRRVSVRITGSKEGFATSSVTSKAAAVTAYNARKPSVTGTAKVGKKLTAARGTWVAPGFSFGYQWLRGGKVISGATRTTYLLKAADKGKKVSVRVTAKRSGFASVVVASAARAVR